MKKLFYSLAAVMCAITLMSAVKDEIMTKSNGVYIVNTTKIASDVKGYKGPTPLKIFIKSNKIQKIEALQNNETPKYFKMVISQLLNKWNGMPVKKVANAKIDGVSGATFSSKAVKENVKRGVDYYLKHK
jgi:electron transport complex protein RnfG